MKFAKKAELPSLKTTVDKIEKVPRGLNSLKSKLNKLEVDNLATVPVDLKKINVVKNDVFKKTVYEW